MDIRKIFCHSGGRSQSSRHPKRQRCCSESRNRKNLNTDRRRHDEGKQFLPKVVFIMGLLFLIDPNLSAKSIEEARGQVVKATLDYLNTPYLWGGEHPGTGLDCSSFARLVYNRAGLSLPRNSREQFKITKKLSSQDVLPGDLIFFSMRMPGSGIIDHVGIYVGKGYFIHASSTNGVHIEMITKPYYWTRFVGIRKHHAL